MSSLRFALALTALVSAPALAQDGAIPISGDLELAQGFDDQRNVQIAAGGPGYLAVWEDERTVVGPFINAGYEPLLGNQRDIYATRLDAAGNVLDAEPIVVCNLGRNQTKPQVAWNGTHWLVVFVSERPDWYFFRDIVGVRIAADGSVVDTTPLEIRMQPSSPSNYYGQNPTVLGRNGDWVVVWEDRNPTTNVPTIAGTRVSGAGVVLDPTWPTLQLHNNTSFGPRYPRIVPLGNELLLVWLELNQGVRVRRISNSLVPVAVPTLIAGTTSQYRPQAASDGQTAFVMFGLKGWRFGTGGVQLDATGITISTSNFNAETTPTVAWNGSSFSTTWAISPGGTFSQPNDVYLARVATNGQVIDMVPIPAAGTNDHEHFGALAGVNGETQFAYLVRGAGLQEDVRVSHVDANGGVFAPQDASTGLRRQEYVQLVTTPAAHVATFASRAGDGSRVLLTRVAADGSPLQAEPLVLATGPEMWPFRPDVGFDGTNLLVVWNDPAGSIVAQRFTPDLVPVDASPFVVFATGATPTVAGNAGMFLVGATFLTSIDVNQLHAKRVSGAGVVLDASPLIVGTNWVETPTFVPYDVNGTGFLAVWTKRSTHDNPASSVHARGVLATGAFSTADLFVSQSGGGLDPDVAVANDRALIVWCDDVYTAGDRIEGRLLLPNGTLTGPDILINDQPFHQSFPTVTTDGARFVVAWVDYRDQLSIEQLRGDIYATSVNLDGTVVSPLGLQVTDGALPEDLPRLSTLDNVVRAFWMDLRTGGSDHVQRLVHRSIDALVPGPWKNLGLALPGTFGAPALSGFGSPVAGSPVTFLVDNAASNAPAWFIVGGTRIDAPFFGGTLVPAPTILLAVGTDADGKFALPVAWPAGIPSGVPLYAQAWLADGAATFGFAATNGLSVTQP